MYQELRAIYIANKLSVSTTMNKGKMNMNHDEINQFLLFHNASAVYNIPKAPMLNSISTQIFKGAQAGSNINKFNLLNTFKNIENYCKISK